MPESDAQRPPPAPSPSGSQSVTDEFPLPPPLLTPTFAQIIDADHFTIERLAAKLRNSATPLSQRKPLLHEITWRLIRHDISEELVMRPTFVRYMGAEGEEMMEHDRRDHAMAKEMLTPLLELDLKEHGEGGKRALARVAKVFDGLTEHMRVESGEMIPKLEALLPRDVSRDLARRYARTLVLTPNVSVPACDGISFTRKKWFQGGVVEFAFCDVENFKSLFESLEREASTDSAWLDRAIREETAALKVGKWKSMAARMRTGDGSADKHKVKI